MYPPSGSIWWPRVVLMSHSVPICVTRVGLPQRKDRDNTHDYHQKAEALLQESTYQPIPNDPTNKYKTKLIALLKSIKTEGGINESTYKKLYPTGA